MTALNLQPAQRRSLRARAHHLDPVVHVGQEGPSAAVTKELDAALRAHELVKVRVLEADRLNRQAMLEQLADSLGAAAVQHIGKLLVLWRPQPEESQATPRGETPRLVKLVTFSKSGNHRATVRTVKVLGNERLSAGGIIKRKRKRPASAKKKAGA